MPEIVMIVVWTIPNWPKTSRPSRRATTILKMKVDPEPATAATTLQISPRRKRTRTVSGTDKAKAERGSAAGPSRGGLTDSFGVLMDFALAGVPLGRAAVMLWRKEL